MTRLRGSDRSPRSGGPVPVSRRTPQGGPARIGGASVGNRSASRLLGVRQDAVSIARAGELATTSSVSATTKSEVEAIMNPSKPTAAGGGGALKAKDLDKDMKAVLDDWFDERKARIDAVLDATAPKREMDQVLEIGREAQSRVDGVFGSYAASASFTPSQAAARGAYKLSDKLTSVNQSPTAGQIKFLLKYLMTIGYAGGPVLNAHNVDMKRKTDKTLFLKLKKDLLPVYKDRLERALKAWPGIAKPEDLTVEIQLGLEPQGSASGKALLGAGYWSTFETMVHEYFHVLAHPKFRAMASGQKNKAARNVMIEGFCDYFAEPFWHASIEPSLGDAKLREAIEGDAYDADNAPTVKDWKSYPEKAQADEIAAKVGDANMRAAYFMGHTELIGGAGYSEEMAGMRDNFEVTSSTSSLDKVAELTNIPENELEAQNKDALDQNPYLFAGQKLVAPGTRYHRVIEGDTWDKVASQYGRDAKALKDSNPGPDISNFDHVLIPRA